MERDADALVQWHAVLQIVEIPGSTSACTWGVLHTRRTVPMDFGRIFAERRVKRPSAWDLGVHAVVANVHELYVGPICRDRRVKIRRVLRRDDRLVIEEP